MNEKLRFKVKEVKAFYGVSYKELAEKIGIKTTSFYSWLKGYFDLSLKKQAKLFEILKLISTERKT